MDLDTLRHLLEEPDHNRCEIAFALLEMRRKREFPGGHKSLHTFVKRELGEDRPHYATLARWVRIAETCEDPKRWPTAGDICRFASDHEPSEDVAPADQASADRSKRYQHRLSESRRATRWSFSPEGPAQAHDVLERIAVRMISSRQLAVTARVVKARKRSPRYRISIGAENLDQSLLTAVGVLGEVARELSKTQKAWERQSSSTRADCTVLEPQLLSRSSAIQLEVAWDDDSQAVIHRGDTAVATLQVGRPSRMRGKIVMPTGTYDTNRLCGVIECVTDNHLRSLPTVVGDRRWLSRLGWQCAESESGGAAAEGVPDLSHQQSGLRLRLPLDGSADLSEYDQPFWLVDSRSADGSISVALGLLQTWAQANPSKRFAAICQHRFLPSETMLAWAGALGNVSVGTFLSTDMNEAEIALRLRAVAHYRDFGVRCLLLLLPTDQLHDSERLRRSARRIGAQMVVEISMTGATADTSILWDHLWLQETPPTSPRDLTQLLFERDAADAELRLFPAERPTPETTMSAKQWIEDVRRQHDEYLKGEGHSPSSGNQSSSSSSSEGSNE